MSRGTQVSSCMSPASDTGLSPSLAKLSSFLLLQVSCIVDDPSTPPPIWERFGLFPLRSPLLGESLLISFPSGTEMFHFPEFASPALCIQAGMPGHCPRRVSPFRNFRIMGCLAPPRNLSQLTTSFIACRYQGIHPMLFSTCLLSFHPCSIVN